MMKLRSIPLSIALLASVALFGCQRKLSYYANTQASSVSGQITLRWSANAGEQDGFKIEQSIDNKVFTTVLNVPDGTTHASLNGLNPGKTYYFRISAYNGAGNSPYSPVAQVTTH